MAQVHLVVLRLRRLIQKRRIERFLRSYLSCPILRDWDCIFVW